MEPEVSRPRSQDPDTGPCPELDQSVQALLTFKSILILSSQLRLCIPGDLLPLRFLTKIFYAPLLSAIRATCPAYHILLNLITRIIFGGEFK
jgi:hypothetical protein